MENLKSQLKTFRMMVIILVLTVIGQCGVFIYQWKNTECTQHKLPKFKITQHSKVVSPAVSAIYELVSIAR